MLINTECNGKIYWGADFGGDALMGNRCSRRHVWRRCPLLLLGVCAIELNSKCFAFSGTNCDLWWFKVSFKAFPFSRDCFISKYIAIGITFGTV